MKKGIILILVILAALVIIVSFYKPWAQVTTSSFVDTVEKITSIFSKQPKVDVNMTLTGYNIPKLANSEESKAALAVMEILTKSSKGLDKKSYLVYLLPLSAIICVLLALAGLISNKKLFIIVMSALSGLIGGVGLYNLSTVKTENLVTKITIAAGLWHTMYAFLFIFLVGVVWLAFELGRR